MTLAIIIQVARWLTVLRAGIKRPGDEAGLECVWLGPVWLAVPLGDLRGNAWEVTGNLHLHFWMDLLVVTFPAES